MNSGLNSKTAPLQQCYALPCYIVTRSTTTTTTTCCKIQSEAHHVLEGLEGHASYKTCEYYQQKYTHTRRQNDFTTITCMQELLKWFTDNKFMHRVKCRQRLQTARLSQTETSTFHCSVFSLELPRYERILNEWPIILVWHEIAEWCCTASFWWIISRQCKFWLDSSTPNLSFPLEARNPHLTQCVTGTRKCIWQTAYKSVERFKQNARMCQTTQRDRPRNVEMDSSRRNRFLNKSGTKKKTLNLTN